MLGLVGLYGSLICMFELDSEVNAGSAELRSSNAMRSIASRTFGLLLALALAFILVLLPGRAIYAASTLVAGSIKAVYWIVVLLLVG